MADLACPVCRSARVRHCLRSNGCDILDAHYGEQFFKNGAEDGHGYEDYLAKSDRRSHALVRSLRFRR